MSRLKRFAVLVVAAVCYLVVFFLDRTVFLRAVETCGVFLKEMLSVMPAVFVLSGLLSVWVPRDTITKHLGSASGVKGKLISLLVGSVSAGPIYAAFPIGKSLLAKGASVANVVTIISAWAVVKIPMLIVEAKFLGIDFMAVRYALTLPAILAVGVLSGRFIRRSRIPLDSAVAFHASERLQALLPQLNCRACGYESCAAYAEALAAGSAEPDRCRPGKEETERKLRTRLEEVRTAPS